MPSDFNEPGHPRDPRSGVHADYVPEGREEEFGTGLGKTREGVNRDFVPEEGANEELRADEKEADEKLADSPPVEGRHPFEGPDQDMYGDHKPVTPSKAEVEPLPETHPERAFKDRPERVGDGSAESADSAITGDAHDSQEVLDGKQDTERPVGADNEPVDPAPKPSDEKQADNDPEREPVDEPAGEAEPKRVGDGSAEAFEADAPREEAPRVPGAGEVG